MCWQLERKGLSGIKCPKSYSRTWASYRGSIGSGVFQNFRQTLGQNFETIPGILGVKFKKREVKTNPKLGVGVGV